ncbi:Radical SAM domain protein [Pseudopedobacter saltans DSM 12145]|uniref:Radical SAM domain protein n=1 Tax=Pseudopedobacter saltans (strain ATCC 51119 / DSM 12145 / JCM 21818 / CCUG 39354 / LMG 10337 / NBRC 100064 / NCIMB 13643) TaxID=762903 RepID=F0S9J2_PSESL|nr:PA0069 family radical SAM protein [Pseudopedobacter saltans]ADY53545.1 Radical SAM domain protein [Pseudopedobacter saltans DSM 12145]
MLNNNSEFLRGRGAQGSINNKFNKLKYSLDHVEGLDEEFIQEIKTEFILEHPKSIISYNKSEDLSFGNSINPYHGCEHGCIYCYARNSHEYWGFDAGLDFESKIIVKPNAADLLRKEFDKKTYKPEPILLSGNTDCYQPAERKFKITRSLLEVFLEYRHPVHIITKNNLILRDIDLLEELNKLHLVSTSVTITSLQEDLRNKLEPRTVTGKGRLKVIRELSNIGIPVNVMVAPIIPGLNSEEIPQIINEASINGAISAGFTIVRLNGAIAEIFTDWIYKTFPDRAEKVIHRIQACHNGKLNDTRWGSRISGDGIEAEAIHQLFRLSLRKYGLPKAKKSLDYTLFRNKHNSQLSLF